MHERGKESVLSTVFIFVNPICWKVPSTKINRFIESFNFATNNKIDWIKEKLLNLNTITLKIGYIFIFPLF